MVRYVNICLFFWKFEFVYAFVHISWTRFDVLYTYIFALKIHYLYSLPSLSDYLLSNNHVNAIIVHKFDFSDEEVMAYYISFLKTLSFRLNKHTIHFFYNEVSY